MTRLLWPVALLCSAGAASVDILPSVYKDGVFRSAVTLPARDTPPGSRAVQLKPDVYGGEWFLTLTGTKLADTVHLAYLGSGQKFQANAATVAKLSARLSSTLATGCFNLSAERLPGLRSWLEERIRLGDTADLNTERSFGPLRVQLLANRTDGDPDSPEGLQQLDIILSRKGTPGAAPWLNACKR